jgi:hypothetical protein
MNHAERLSVLLDTAYKVPDHSRAGDTSIHVSDLIDFCAREYWLCKTHDRGYHPHKYHPMGTKYTFDMGHAIQKIMINRLLSQQVLFGAWRCRHCNDLTYGFQDDKMACDKCKCRAIRYEDLAIEYTIPVNTKPKTQILVVAHIDFVVAVSEERGFIVDGKSIKAENYDDLKPAEQGGEPAVGYKRQVQLYMHLPTKTTAKIVGRPRDDRARDFHIDRNHAVVCYAVKGQRPQPFKPYLVAQAPSFVQGIDDKLAALKTALEKKKSPIKICTAPNNLMAKECSCRDICFDQRLDGK